MYMYSEGEGFCGVYLGNSGNNIPTCVTDVDSEAGESFKSNEAWKAPQSMVKTISNRNCYVNSQFGFMKLVIADINLLLISIVANLCFTIGDLQINFSIVCIARAMIHDTISDNSKCCHH